MKTESERREREREREREQESESKNFLRGWNVEKQVIAF
jgi:hypothetical protein